MKVGNMQQISFKGIKFPDADQWRVRSNESHSNFLSVDQNYMGKYFKNDDKKSNGSKLM